MCSSDLVGERMDINHTRAIIDEVLAGRLSKVATRTDPNLNLEVPVTCEGVPDEVLDPRATWSDKKQFDLTAVKLKEDFQANIAKFDDDFAREIAAHGPK